MKPAALLLLGGLAWAQTQPEEPLLRWLNSIAQSHLDGRERAIAAIQTKADAERRKAVVRERILKSIGGLPDYKGPLHARETGRIAADGYVIEKVLFESLPRFLVSANVYRPTAPGRYPGVLVPSGHTQEGKPEPQILAANLAKKGYVALTYDPIGQGEREQTYLPILGRPLSGGGGNEHLELGARSILIGQSVARYFIFDGMRGIDYLISRADVNPDRIGVTGCSGGGAITTYVGALDPRVKAAAPGCSINSFRTLFTGPTADSEMSLPAFLANGLDMADFYELSAPMPWLLMATTEDYFTPASAKPVYEEVRRWYGFYGAEERVRFDVEDGPHGTPKPAREEIYRWMDLWLKDGKGDRAEMPVKLYTNLELRVTASGNVQDEPASRKLHQILFDEFEARRQPRTVPELAAELRRLGVASDKQAPATRVMEQSTDAEFRTEQLQWECEPGVSITGKLYLPTRASGKLPAVVLLAEKRLPVPLYVQRSQSTVALAEALAKAGQIVLELEPRDMPSAIDGRPFLGNWLTNERFDLIGRNLAASRAHDILVAVDVLAARPEVDAGAIRGYARGVKGFWLLMAAAADSRLQKVWLDRSPYSFRSAFEAPLASFLFEVMIPGFALHWEIDDLVELAKKPRVYRTDPATWMNRIVDRGPSFRYRTVGEGDALCIQEFLR